MKSIPALSYSGTKGNGPVLPVGKNIVHISAVALTDDSVSNPFSTEDQEPKARAYDDCYPVVAVKVTNKDGGLTERYHFLGFKKYASLTEAEKAMTTTFKGETVPLYSQDMTTGYALTYSIGADGKKVAVETGVIVDGKPEKRPAMERVIDEAKSKTAVRILCDFLVACRIPANESLTPEAIVEQIGKCTSAIEITVTEELYEGKTRSRMTNPRLVATAVPTDEVAETAPAVRDEDDF